MLPAGAVTTFDPSRLSSILFLNPTNPVIFASQYFYKLPSLWT